MRQPYVTKKVSKRTGQTRYTAMYFDDKGIRRSAGTYDDELEVLGAARREQGKEAGDSLDSMTLAQKAGRDFRGVLADLREASPGGAQHNAELFLDVDQPRPALFGNVPHRDVQLHQRDQVLHGPHRGRGDCQYSEALPLATSPSRSKTVFWNLCSHLPLETQRLFAEYIISTGVRFCEAISFQEGDLNYGTGMLTICRSTVEVSKKYHPTGGRFLTRPYTKNGNHRRLKIGRPLVEKIHAHVKLHGMKPGDLIFPIRLFMPDTAWVNLPRCTEEELLEARKTTFISPVTGNPVTHGKISTYRKHLCRCAPCVQTYRDGRSASRSGPWLARGRSC